MPSISVRGIDVYWAVQGTGQRVLYISGTGGDLRRKPNAFDSPLPERFEVLSYDQRGLGQTEGPERVNEVLGRQLDRVVVLGLLL